MEGFIFIIIIGIVFSALFSSAAKKAKKTGSNYKPPVDHTFDNAFDFDKLRNNIFDPNAYRTAKTQAPPETRQNTAQYYNSNETDYVENTITENITEDIEGSTIAADTRMESRMLDMDMSVLKEDIAATNEIKLNINDSQKNLNRMKLFENRNEVLKAVIYSEIMQPRFKHRKIR